MAPKLLLVGSGALIMSLSVVAYGDAKYPQAQGATLLQPTIEQNNGLFDSARTSLSIGNAEKASMLTSANKALKPASSGRDTMFVINHGGGGGGTGSGTGSGSGSGSGSGTGSASKHQANDVPEPFSMILLGTGLAGLAATLRRRRLAPTIRRRRKTK